MRLYDIISEAPLVDFEPLGDFSKPGSFNDKRDKKLVTHPVNKLKLITFFEKTPYDFRIFPINAPGLRKYSETGVVDHNWISNELGKTIPDAANTILNDNSDTITIVYVSNVGADKVVMTPWIMAHRFGHAIQRSNFHSWKEAEKYLFNDINDVLNEFYGVRGLRGDRFDQSYTTYYNALFNAIGTQRSSRQQLITRPYEFLYEIFTQFLMSGEVTLNPLPTRLQYGRAIYGKKSSLTADRELISDMEYKSQYIANTMQYAFDDVLNECVGKIFVM